jgi:outer membrane receptor protein involved in Fe transport
VDFYVPELGLLAQAIGVPEQYQPLRFDTPDFETSSWAIFGESYYDVSDKFKLTHGLRYTEEEKDIITRQVSPLSFLNPAFDINNSYNTGNGEWEEFTGKLGFSYQPELDFTDDTFIFGTLSRGYKGGGINPGASETSFPTFDPEYINALEFGAKNRLMDNKVQFNMTAFFYRYDGYQTAGILPDSTTFNTNVDAEVQGAEFELVAAPVDGLRIDFNYALLSTEITDDFDTSPDIAQSSTSGPVNIKGNELPYAPDSSIQFGLQYTHPIGDAYELTWRAQTYWQDEYWARLYNNTTDRLDSWQQTDLNLSLKDMDNTWEVELFVKNASDEASISSLSVEGAFIGRYRQPQALNPRTWGIRFHYLFE